MRGDSQTGFSPGNAVKSAIGDRLELEHAEAAVEAMERYPARNQVGENRLIRQEGVLRARRERGS